MPPIAAPDHVTGTGPEAIVYFDLACPRCAVTWLELRALELRLCARHFPVAAKRPRAPALHAAAEAVALQDAGAFWVFCDSLYADRGRVDDPHLWERVTGLGLELERFEADRRSDAVAARVRRDFQSAIRAGIVATPTAFASEERFSDSVAERLTAIAAGRHR